MRSLVACALAAVAAAQGNINVNWAQPAGVGTLKTEAALQVVVNPLLTRASPVHDQIFASLKALQANHVRFVPWLPYPKLGVAALEPPSKNPCGFVNSGGANNPYSTTISCGGAGLITGVKFASYGNPTGYCGSLQQGSCNSANSQSVVEAACVGKSSCTIASNDETFGGAPCGGTATRLAVEVTCSNTSWPGFTYWNFTLLDELMEDFMGATADAGSSVVINFSTPPSWLYQGPRVLYPDDPLGETWNYEQGTVLADPTGQQFGEYYGRLVAWYTEGGFTDEFGIYYGGGHYYNISYWECLNEPEGEHQNNPQSYTKLYDAMVTNIRKFAPNGSKNMQFYGMALEGHHEWNWYNYFLNASNHVNGVLPEWASFHFYASCSSRSDPTTYTQFFADADNFIAEVANIITIRDALAPSVKLDPDELGVILPDDNDPAFNSTNPGFPNVYWNAAAAMYAYLFGNLALQGVDVLGESQLVGYPNMPQIGPQNIWGPQYPSVALLNWTDGSGTARYWVLRLLSDHTSPGDTIVNTTINPAVANPFCGSVINLGNLSLMCTGGATINKIDFASYGTPTGTCGSYAVGSCNAANSTAIVESFCLGQTSCTIPADTPHFGDPCYGTVKYLVVQAECSSGSGGYSPGATTLYAQAFVSASGTRKVLVVNKNYAPSSVTMTGATGGTFVYIDESTAFGPPASMTLTSDTIQLAPYSTGFIIMP